MLGIQRRIAAIAALIVLTTALQASAGTASGFEDVDDSHLFAEPINWLRTTGITKGCNPPSNTRFCPADRITREQMATFLARALSLPNPGTSDWFLDDDDSPHEIAINQIAAHGDNDSLADLWAVFEEFDVELVLAGHDHNYERFAPLTADGSLAVPDGVQSFVVGTGGTYLRRANTPRTGSEVLIDDTHGVLQLDLAEAAYEWRFVGIAGITFDSDSRACS